MIVSSLSSEGSAEYAPSYLEEEVAEQAERRLRVNSYLALKNISCEFHEGVLTLRGWLPSYYLKQIAQEVVSATAGVERIENRIEVLASARHAEHGV